MRIGHIELFVRNPAESRAFYERVLGFEVKAVQGQLVWLKLGDSEFYCARGAIRAPHNNTEMLPPALSFTRITWMRLWQRCVPADWSYVEMMGRNARLFTDPDGHWFQIVNSSDQS